MLINWTRWKNSGDSFINLNVGKNDFGLPTHLILSTQLTLNAPETISTLIQTTSKNAKTDSF